MTVRVSKTEFNLREKLSELDIPVGNHGSQLMRSSSPEESFFLTQAGRKNYFINGGCSVWQRGTAAPSHNNYGCDRFWFANGASQVDRSTETPEKKGFCYSMKVTSNGSGTSIGQPIELIATGKSQFKPGQRYTLSVWARTDSVVSNNLSFVIYYRNSKFSGTNQVNWAPSVAPFAGQMTKKWKRFSVSCIAPDVNSNNVVLAIELAFSATAYFTGFQFEEGDLTEFEHRSYAEELNLCHRYFFKNINESGEDGCNYGKAFNNNEMFASIRFPTPMRATPTIIAFSNSGTAQQVHKLGNPDTGYSSIDRLDVYGGMRFNSSGAWGTADTDMYSFTFQADAEL